MISAKREASVVSLPIVPIPCGRGSNAEYFLLRIQFATISVLLCDAMFKEVITIFRNLKRYSPCEHVIFSC